MKVREKIAAGFLLVVIVIWGIILFNRVIFLGIYNEFKMIKENIVTGATAVEEMHRTAIEVNLKTFEYVVHHDEKFKKDALSALQRLKEMGKDFLEHKCQIGGEELRNAGELMAEIKKVELVVKEIISLKVQKLGIEYLRVINEEKLYPAMASLFVQLEEFKTAHTQVLAETEGTVLQTRLYVTRLPFVAGSLFTLLAIVITFFTTRSITKPLYALQKGVEIIGEGHLDHKVVTQKKDEIGRLSRAFDRMVEHIKEKNRDLTAREERAMGAVEETNNVLMKVAGGDYSVQAGVSDKNDVFDSLAMGVNMMIEDIGNTIAERDNVEKKLKESEKYHREIIQTSLDGFWITDREGRFLDVNNAYCKMTGYSHEELLGGMSIHDIETVENEEETAGHINNILKRGYDRFETCHRRKDGKIIDVEVSATRSGEKSGQLVVFLRDITERKKDENKIYKAKEDAEEFNRIAVGRELRMIELKQEINRLLEQDGMEAKYEIVQ